MEYKFLSRKNSILNSAIEILESHGVQGMTMKAIAIKEGVTEPAIYRHFSGKKQIILEILEEFSRYDEQIINTIIQNGLKSTDALRFFFSSLTDYYQGYPEVVTVMFSLDVYRYQEETNKKMSQIIKRRYDFINKFVEEGLTEGKFAVNLEKEMLVELIYGVLMSTTSSWKREACQYNLKKRVEKMFDSIICG